MEQQHWQVLFVTAALSLLLLPVDCVAPTAVVPPLAQDNITADIVARPSLRAEPFEAALRLLQRGGTRRDDAPLSLLFVGDSSVRNTALALLLSMCNADGDFFECDAAIALPFLAGEDEGRQRRAAAAQGTNAFKCPVSQRGRQKTQGHQHPDSRSHERTMNGTRRCASAMQPVFTPLRNLSSAAFYHSRGERAARWRSHEVMPLLTLSYRGNDSGRGEVLVHILEAGCASRTDGVWRMMDFLIESTSTAVSAGGGPRGGGGGVGFLHTTDGAFVPFHALIVSGGLHCSYKVYRGGNWYSSLFQRIPAFTAVSGGCPVVWLEVTHCLKGEGGHFYRQGSKFLLNYRKLAACPYIDQHVPVMNSLVAVAGALVAPTRHITRTLSLLSASTTAAERRLADAEGRCLFVDLMHPSVECYLRIAWSVAQTIAFALQRPASPRPASALSPQPLFAGRASKHWSSQTSSGTRLSAQEEMQPSRLGAEGGVPHKGPAMSDGDEWVGEQLVLGSLVAVEAVVVLLVVAAAVIVLRLWRRKRLC
jgi:hypothetical protein